jgi:hypothetical protein
MGLIVEKSYVAFLLVTVVIGGGGALMIGRAMAKTWKPFWQAALFVAVLGAGVRFLHWGLFLGATFPSWRQAQGDLTSLHYYFVDTAVLLAIAGLGFRVQRAAQMALQYDWLITKTSAMSWRLRS